MRFEQTRPCSQCPFRRKSLPGWLGAASPEGFIDSALSDELMPCHKTVDYESPDWQEEMMGEDSSVQHCAGTRIMYRNLQKRSRNWIFLTLEHAACVASVEPSAEVFATREEFLSHHKSSPPSGGSDRRS